MLRFTIVIKCLLIIEAFSPILLGGPGTPRGQQTSPLHSSAAQVDTAAPTKRCTTKTADIKNSTEETPRTWFKPEWVLIWVTAAYVVISAWTLVEIRRQSKIANKTLIATFRPKLIVRRVSLRTGTVIPTLGVPDPKPWAIDFAIANTGGSTAHITSSGFAETVFDSGLPALLPYADHCANVHLALQPGEERAFSVELGKDLVFLFRALRAVKGRDLSHQRVAHIYFWGRMSRAEGKFPTGAEQKGTS